MPIDVVVSRRIDTIEGHIAFLFIPRTKSLAAKGVKIFINPEYLKLLNKYPAYKEFTMKHELNEANIVLEAAASISGKNAAEARTKVAALGLAAHRKAKTLDLKRFNKLPAAERDEIARAHAEAAAKFFGFKRSIYDWNY